jgi:hypothetical protein
MANFNISTVFSAINNMTAPIRQMQQSLLNFNNQVNHSNQTLNRFGNNKSLGKLQIQVVNLKNHFKDLSGAMNSAGNKLTTIGTIGTVGGLAALSTSLDPVRAKEAVQGALGIEYTKKDQKMNYKDRMKVGQQQYEYTASIAPKLPGAITTLGSLRSLMHKYGTEGNLDTITGITNLLPGMMKGKLDDEVVSGLQAVLSGNQSDLFEKVGLKLFTDDKTHLHGFKSFDDKGKEQKITFKNPDEMLRYIIKFGLIKFPDATKVAMESTEGKESNLGDAKNNFIVELWTKTGALAIYQKKVEEITQAFDNFTPQGTKIVTQISGWINKNEELFNGILIGVPSLIAAGLAFKAIGFAVSGFSFLVPVIAALVSPIGAVVIVISLLIAGFVLLHNKLKDMFKDNWFFKPLWGAGSDTDNKKADTSYNKEIERLKQSQQKEVENSQAIQIILNQTNSSDSPIISKTSVQSTGNNKVKVNTGNASGRGQSFSQFAGALPQ